MSLSAAEVEEALLALSTRERAAVIHHGLKSLGPTTEEEEQEEIQAAWREEFAHRIESIENGTATLIPLEEAFARARRALKTPSV